MPELPDEVSSAIMQEHLAVQCLIEAAYAEADANRFGEGINDAVIRDRIQNKAFQLIEERGLDSRCKRIVEIMLVMRNPDNADVYHNQFGRETKCEWPLGCCACGANDDQRTFVNRWRRIKILPDLFSINSDHLIANRYNQETRMINLCALHNRQKQDGLWVAWLMEEI